MKKSLKLIFVHSVLSFLLIFGVILGCLSDGSQTAYAKKNPSISKSSATMKPGNTLTLRVKNASKKVKWSSGKKKVVKIVSTSGKKKEKAVFVALKGGKATITAKVGKNKLKTVITVKKEEKPTHVHSYTMPATCTSPAMCSCGLTYGASLGHNMEAANCQHPARCTRCGFTQGTVAAHSYDLISHRCTVCNQLDLHSVLTFELSNTAAEGALNIRWMKLWCSNTGLSALRIPGVGVKARAYTTAEATTPVLLTLTNEEDQQLISTTVPANSNGEAFFDTMDDNVLFSFLLEGRFQFEAQYGDDNYDFTVYVKGNGWTFDFVKK